MYVHVYVHVFIFFFFQMLECDAFQTFCPLLIFQTLENVFPVFPASVSLEKTQQHFKFWGKVAR